MNINKYTAVDPETFNPAMEDAMLSDGHQDKGSGGILSVDRVKVPGTDGIDTYLPEPTDPIYRQWTSTGAGFLPSASIDCAGFRNVSAVVEVTQVSGASAFLEIQWSMDGINWFWELWRGIGTPVGSEAPTLDYILYNQFSGTGLGIQPLANRFMQVKARFMRGMLKTSSGTIGVKLHVQLL